MRATVTAGLLISAIGLSAATPDDELARLQGVYRQAFTNHMADGEAYRSVDEIGIRRRGPDSAHVSVHLEFRNGHTCDIAGVTHYDQGVFSMDAAPAPPAQGPCAFTLTVLPQVLKVGAVGEGCFAYCGMRGILNGAELKRSTRRPLPRSR
jgi:hypothetical protein